MKVNKGKEKDWKNEEKESAWRPFFIDGTET
jgi:hypothetical protein